MEPFIERDAMFLVPGQRVGRYEIIGLLGAGGMGAVYRARDGDLGRTVALKVLRRAEEVASAVERARFLGEAQTLARLSHPNIVTIYDCGDDGGQLFIAMELIDGMSLRAWLAERPRSWRETRDVFAAAGRGLEAAHKVGIVHRDFKPHNVIIAADRVVVVDFGLARPVGRGGDGDGAMEDLPISGDVSLTATGLVVGTPAYMSPEQYDRSELTPRSDIWSFSVALFEALYGRRPFRALTTADLAIKIRRRPLVFPPGRRVPRFLASLVQRGLAVDPEERPPSMAAVVAELRRDPARRALKVAAAGAAACLVAGAYPLLRTSPSPCAGAAAALDGVWSASARATLEAAFAPTGPSGIDAAARAARGLDAYAGEWRAMRVEVCRATFERGAQSPALLDLRMTCLDRRRDTLAALVGMLAADADAELARRAVELVAGLPSLAPCADARGLGERVPLPDDPGQRAAVASLEREVDRVGALVDAGRATRALPELPVVIVAAGSGHAPLRARALLLVGRFLGLRGIESPRPVLDEALRAAAAARDDALAAEVWLALLATPGLDPAADAWLAAEAAAERAGGDPRLRAAARKLRGRRLNELGRFSEAMPYLERAVAELRARGRAADPDLASALLALSQAQAGHADLAAGHRSAAEAVAIYEATLGPGHPLVASGLMAVGNNTVDLDEKERAYSRARDVYAASVGPEHDSTIRASNNLAVVLRRRARPAEALAIYRQNLAILERTPRADSTVLIKLLLQLSSLQRVLGPLDEAERIGRRGAELARARLAATDPLRADVESDLAETLHAEGKSAEALLGFEAALRGLEGSPDSRGVRLFLLLGLGETLVAVGRAAEGVQRLDQTLALDSTQAYPDTRARVRARAAEALWRVPAERRRAIEVARQAEADFAAAGLPDDERKIRAWREAHRR